MTTGDFTVVGKPDEAGKRATSDSRCQSHSLRAAHRRQGCKKETMIREGSVGRSVMHQALVTYRWHKGPAVFQLGGNLNTWCLKNPVYLGYVFCCFLIGKTRDTSGLRGKPNYSTSYPASPVYVHYFVLLFPGRQRYRTSAEARHATKNLGAHTFNCPRKVLLWLSLIHIWTLPTKA